MLRQSPPRQAAALFQSAYRARPAAGASAPGRVNLIGEHTDYNGGPVLPLALERRTAVVCGPGDGWTFVSATDDRPDRRYVEERMAGRWSDYLVGVVRELAERGAAPSGAQVAVATSVPIGAGLSSSAALTVAAAKAISTFAGRRLSPAVLADVAYRAEYHQVGVRCGRMDQTIAAHARAGTALLFDTATGGLRLVPFPGRLWIVETGVSHKLTGGELNERRRECEAALACCRERWPGLASLAALPPEDLPAAEGRLPPPLARRVRHVVTETARTRSAAQALAAGELEALGAILVAGHRSLRDDYESSCPEADRIVDTAVAAGAWGARLTGAGWGGAVLVLAAKEREAAIIAGVTRDFEAAFGRTPAAWATRAAAGVRREPVGA
jgi:galactokinase